MNIDLVHANDICFEKHSVCEIKWISEIACDLAEA